MEQTKLEADSTVLKIVIDSLRLSDFYKYTMIKYLPIIQNIINHTGTYIDS